MNFERLAWWLFWFSFGLVILILFYGLTILFITSTSVELAFILGLISSLLMANKLLFGYGSVANLLDNVISLNEIKEEHKDKIKENVNKRFIPLEQIEKFSFATLISLALKDLDYYRYAYYSVYMLLVVITILAKFNLLGEFVLGKYVEGVFWGATTTTFFVWGLEQLAKVSFTEFLNLNLSEENNQ